MDIADKKNILLVEDDMITAQITKHQLEKKGYIVQHAINGEQAITYVQNEIYDLILMDIDLGSGIDGTQAAVEILKTREIPVLFVSSHTEPEIVAKTEKITSYGYVVKHSGIIVLDASIKMAFRLFDSNNNTKIINEKLESTIEDLRIHQLELQTQNEELREK